MPYFEIVNTPDILGIKLANEGGNISKSVGFPHLLDPDYPLQSIGLWST
jgi:hypothetical protein